MNILANLSIKMKIMLMLVAPVVGLLYFSIDSVVEKSRIVGQMENMQSLAGLVEQFKVDDGVQGEYVPKVPVEPVEQNYPARAGIH